MRSGATRLVPSWTSDHRIAVPLAVLGLLLSAGGLVVGFLSPGGSGSYEAPFPNERRSDELATLVPDVAAHGGAMVGETALKFYDPQEHVARSDIEFLQGVESDSPFSVVAICDEPSRAVPDEAVTCVGVTPMGNPRFLMDPCFGLDEAPGLVHCADRNQTVRLRPSAGAPLDTYEPSADVVDTRYPWLLVLADGSRCFWDSINSDRGSEEVDLWLCGGIEQYPVDKGSPIESVSDITDVLAFEHAPVWALDLGQHRDGTWRATVHYVAENEIRRVIVLEAWY